MHQLKTLPNGVRIIYEKLPSVRSASVGIFVDVGSRCEAAAECGSSHFIEHMLFKSTTKHTAAEMAYITDGVGGQINAFTTRECTCFYAKVLDTHLKTAIDLLAEMFFDCAFDEAETDSERGVILEEIGMYEDTPDDVCYEQLMSRCHRGALGRPVLGKPATLSAMTGETLRAYKDRHYIAGNLVISLCGSFTEEHIALLESCFGDMPKMKKERRRSATYTPVSYARKKRLEQNQLCIAFPSNSVGSDERYAMNLLSTVLGGGVSSRLFQNIREKHGLCYSIYSFQSCFKDCGIAAVATAVGKDTELKTLELIRDELKKIKEEGVSEDELSRAREQAKSALVMSLESTASRMMKLGNAVLALGYSNTVDQVIANYDAVTRDDLLRLANERFDFDKMSVSALGRVEDADTYRNVLMS